MPKVRRFYLYRGLLYLSPWMPIWVIFLQQERGLNLVQIATLDAIFWAVLATCEIPAGIIADTFGCRRSVASGIALQACSILLYTLAPTYELLLVANIMWALAVSFISGADQSLLFDTLRSVKQEQEYARVAGRSQAIVLGGAALGSVIGGYLGSFSLILPMIVTSVLNLLALVVVLTLDEPSTTSRSTNRRTFTHIAREMVQILRGKTSLRYILFYAALLPLATYIVSMVYLQLYARSLGFSVLAIGFLLMGVRGAGIVGSLVAHFLEKRIAQSVRLLLAPVFVVTALLMMALLDSLPGIIIFIIACTVPAALQPSIEKLIMERVPDDVRATAMSLQSLLFTASLLVVEPAFSFLADSRSYSVAYTALAGFIGLTIGGLSIWRLFASGTRPPHQQTAV